MPNRNRPLALVTGVGRSIGIGASIANQLANDGWDIATAGWRPYDDRMPWKADPEPLADYESDLSDPQAPTDLVRRVTEERGSIGALILSHCESVDSDLHTTTVESFDRHMAVNARAAWLLIRAFAEQFGSSSGRIISITSDHTAFNLAYGASKAAMDRIVLAAAIELAGSGITANVINPGATDTGWMDVATTTSIADRNLQPRVGDPQDTANLVSFLCSPEGQWINGQTLYSDGGLRP